MSQASKEALLFQIHSGSIKTHSAKVLEYVIRRTKNKHHTTIKNIERNCQMKLSTVVARLSELEELGLVYKKGMTETTFIYPQPLTKYYYESNHILQIQNQEKIFRKKFYQSIKSLTKRFGSVLHSKTIIDLNNYLPK